MPRGYSNPREARLESFGPRLLPESPAWLALRDWRLVHKAGANTPNWDIAAGCEIEGRAGIVLVEAKANWPELGVGGSRSPPGRWLRSGGTRHLSGTLYHRIDFGGAIPWQRGQRARFQR